MGKAGTTRHLALLWTEEMDDRAALSAALINTLAPGLETCTSTAAAI